MTSIDWDDERDENGDVGCSECLSSECIDGFCATQWRNTQDPALSLCEPDAFPCRMKFYVAWGGTDSSGTIMRSAGSLPSNFRSFSGQTIFFTAGDITLATIQDVNDTINNVTDAIDAGIDMVTDEIDDGLAAVPFGGDGGTGE